MKFPWTRSAGSRLPWDADAEAALKRIPQLVRAVAKRKIADAASKRGAERVSTADVLAAWSSFAAGKKGIPAALESAMPAPNRQGVSMILVSACHNKAAGCPNPLIDTDVWKSAISVWVVDSGMSERLRRRVAGDTIFMHHKIKVSISGCPNGCSRPQIADFGLTGFVTPVFDADACTACGACVKACPDSALTLPDDGPVMWEKKTCQGCLACSRACAAGAVILGERGIRLTVGGKLGRHPHLADFAGKFSSPEPMIAVMEKMLDDFIKNAEPDERFAAYRLR